MIKHFLGELWIKRNLLPDIGSGHMKLLEDGSAEAEIQAARMWDLAELLFNLRDVDGFHGLVRRMRTAEAEASVAELQVGRILYVNDVNFRFVLPRGQQRNDYDLEITYPDGLVSCGETKCKVESTTLGENTIEGVLEKARGQLPPDKPGIIFVKVPKAWVESAESQRFMIQMANRFFTFGENVTANSAIVSIVYYGEPLAWKDGILAQGHRQKEVGNPFNKFAPFRSWTLLNYFPPPGAGWDKLPAKWVRLVNFPDELGKRGRT